MADIKYKHLKGLTGLTREDREQWEKDNLEALYETDYFQKDDLGRDNSFKSWVAKASLENLDQYQTEIVPRIKRGETNLVEMYESLYNDTSLSLSSKRAENKLLYQQRYGNEGLLSPTDTDDEEEITAFKNILQHNSWYYNNYLASNEYSKQSNIFRKRPTTVAETFWNSEVGKQTVLKPMMAQYKLDIALHGEEYANSKLESRVRDFVADKQTIIEKLERTLIGNAFNAASSIIGSAGVVWGAMNLGGSKIVDLFTSEEKDMNMSFAEIFDNNVVEFASKLTEEYNTEIVRSTEEVEGSLWDNIFSWNTLFELGQQAGFSTGASLTGRAATVGMKVIKTGSKLAPETIEGLKLLTEGFEKSSKVRNLWNSIAVPTLVGSGEGALNAYQTKYNFIDNNTPGLEEATMKYRNLLTEDLLSDPIKLYNAGYEFDNTGKLTLSGVTQLQNDIDLQVEEYKKSLEENLENEANKAGILDFLIESAINGGINATAKRFLLGDNYVASRYKALTNKLETPALLLDDAGRVIVNKPNIGKQALNIIKEPIGEGIEEYSQSLSSDLASSIYGNRMEQYLEQKYSLDGNKAVVYDIADYLAAGAEGLWYSATSKEAIQSAIYGVLGSSIGAVGAGSLYRNPMYDAVKRNNEDFNKMQETADYYNSWLDKDNNKQKFTELASSISWAIKMAEAEEKGDIFEFKNSEFGKTVQDFYLLQQLKGTMYHDALINMYHKILETREGSDFANSVVKESEGRELKDVQKDVKNILDVYDKVEKAGIEIEKSLGKEVPKNVKEALVYGKLAYDNLSERKKKIENQIKEVEVESEISMLSDKSKRAIALHGTTLGKAQNRLDAKIIELEQNIEKNRKIYNNKATSDKERKKADNVNKRLKSELSKLKGEKSKLNAEISVVEAEMAERGDVLTALDILNLPALERAIMLSPSNLKNYSKKQQEIINNVIAAGTQKNADFLRSILDAGRIEDEQRDYLTTYSELQRDPTNLIKYDKELKVQKQIELKEEGFKSLNEIKDYKEFVAAYLDAESKIANDFTALVAMNKQLKDNAFYKKFIGKRNTVNSLTKQLRLLEELSEDKRVDKVLPHIVSYLAQSDIDITNYSEVLEFLSTSGKEGLQSYLESYNNNVSEENRISLEDIGEIYEKYGKALQKYLENEEEKAKINPPSTLPSSVESTPSNKGEDVITSTIEDVNKDTDEELTERRININVEEVNAELRSFINDVEAYIVFSFDISSEIKDVLLDTITQTIKNSESKSLEEIKLDLNLLLLNSLQDTGLSEEDKNKAYISIHNFIEDYALKNQRTNKDIESKKEPNYFRQYFDVALVPDKVQPLFNGWGVPEFLNSGKLSTKDKVYFITNDTLTDTVKESMGEAYSEDEHLPILIVVESKYGPLEDGNKRYQPIGLLPSNTSGKANLYTKELRKLALTSKDKNNKPIIKGNARIESTALVQEIGVVTSKSKEKDTNSRDFIENSISPQIKNTIFGKNRRKEILETLNESMSVETITDNKGKVRQTLFLTLPGLGKFEVLTNAPYETTNKDGKTISEIESAQELYTFNSKVTKLFDTLIKVSKLITEHGIYFKDGRYGSSNKELDVLLQNLDRKINDYLYIPNSVFSISNDKGNVTLIEESNGIVIQSIPFAVAGDKNSISTVESLQEFITNILKRESGVNWQIEKSGEEPSHKKEIEEGLFRFPISSMNPQRYAAPRIANPHKYIPLNVETEVLNSDNANTNPSPITSTATGKIMNTETEEVIVKGKEIKMQEGKTKAEKIANTIVEDSKKITLSADERSYIDSDQKMYMRVTEAISDTPIDMPESMKVVSTTIGNSVDEFIRGVFSGEYIADEEGYITDKNNSLINLPGIAPNTLKHFYKSIQNIKNSLELKGWSVIPRDVTVTGSIKVANSDGNIEEKLIAGTLDLLAYDENGNFHIIDIKSYRTDISGDKLEKYKKQVSLYAELLEKKYGVKVSTVNLLPIQVDYPLNEKDIYTFDDKGLQLNGYKFTASINPNNKKIEVTVVERVKLKDILSTVKEDLQSNGSISESATNIQIETSKHVEDTSKMSQEEFVTSLYNEMKDDIDSTLFGETIPNYLSETSDAPITIETDDILQQLRECGGK